MDARLADVLTLLVEDFIDTAEPVGSQTLVREHDLDMSPATIRNWFSDLEEEGYLIQPHSSAGRIPSESAFHWYVENRLEQNGPRKRDCDLLRQAAAGVKDKDGRIKACAKACSEAAGAAAIVATNRSDSYYTGLSELFRQPEFRDWSRVVTMSSVLDKLDERLQRLRQSNFAIPTILLGRDCPFGNACGTVAVTLPWRAVFVLLGPMRMSYRKAKSLEAALVQTI